jgi:hypothetical protein
MPTPSPPAASAAAHKVVKKNKPTHAGHDSADDAATKAADANATAKLAAANAKAANAKTASASPTTTTTTSTTTKAPTTVASADKEPKNDSKSDSKSDSKNEGKNEGKTAEPSGAATGATAGQASGSAGSTAADSAGVEAGHEIRVTSKPVGADVALDGVSVGKTPYSGSIADVSAPHAIAVKKDGFEPFEQMISASSAWTKTKLPKGKPGPQVLKISAKLKQVGGGEGKSASEARASSAEGASKGEATRSDRPLPPSEEGSPKDTPP